MRLESGILIFLLLAATVVASFFVPPFYAAMLIPAMAFGAILIGHPRVFLYVYLLVMGIYPLLQDILPFRPIKFTNELMGLILFSVFLGQLALRQINFRIVKKWMPLFGWMLGYSVVSWLLNRVSPKPALQSIFLYFSFIPIFILAVNYFTKRDLRVIIFGTIGFFWLNFALNIGWRFGFNPLYNSALAGTGYGGSGIIDSSQGTFSGQTHVAYFCCMFMFLLFSFKVRGVAVLGKKYNGLILITLGAALVQLYLTYTNHAFIYFFLALIPYLLFTGLWRSKQAIAALLALFVLVALALAFSEPMQTVFSKDSMTRRQRNFHQNAKIQLFGDLLVDNLRDEPMIWTFGVGPGNGMGSIAKEARSPFALKMLLPYYLSGKNYQEQQMSSITGNTSSAIFTLWGDFGLVGFLLFLGLYLWAFRQCLAVKRQFKKGSVPLCLAEAMVGIFAFFAICNITFDELSMSSLSCWIWMLLALVALFGQSAMDGDLNESN